MEVLNYKRVKKTFEANCKHQDAYKDESIKFNWAGCRDCDLSNSLFHDSQWVPPDFSIDSSGGGIRRKTLCFAIWHEDYLHDVIEHIQNHDCPLSSQTVLVHEGIAYMPLIEVQRVVRDLKNRIHENRVSK